MATFDRSLWSSLPPDIWEKVLAREGFVQIPHCLQEVALFACQFQFPRPSCWNAPKRIHNSGLEWQQGGCDLRQSRWSVIDVSVLRTAFSFIGVRNYKIEAAQGSLLAAWSASKNEKMKAVVICNPIAKTWRHLPPMVIHMVIRTVVHMEVDSKTSALRMFVLGFESHTAREPLFQIYDSLLDCWRLRSYPPGIVQSSRPLSGLLYNGTFHALFYDISSWQNHLLMAYTMAEDVWTDVRVRFPRFFVRSHLLVANSRLYLVKKPVDNLLDMC